MRLKHLASAIALAAAAVPAQAGYVGFETVWQFDHDDDDDSGASTSEIVAFDSVLRQVYVSGGAGVDVLDFDGTLVRGLGGQPAGSDTTALDVTSVAVKNGVVAMAGRFQPAAGNAYGGVRLYGTDGSFIRDIQVTSDSPDNLPDTVSFTPDGSRLIVANEGESGDGSIGLIDVASGAVTLLGFDTFDTAPLRAALKAKGVLLNDGQSLNAQLQPEFVAISKDGSKAFVTIQEQNAVAVVDLVSNSISDIVSAGSVDRGAVRFDPSDRDGPGNSQSPNPRTFANVFSTMEPDQVVWFERNGQKFFAVAGEGDDGIALASGFSPISNAAPNLDPTKFPDPASVVQNGNLGRIAKFGKDTDGDGDFDEIWVTGGRSISIFKEDGTLVWNSGSLVEDTLIAQGNGYFNDGRSDNRGPEPEGVTYGFVGGKPYLFVSIERGASVLMLDISDVANPLLEDFIATDFTAGFERLNESEGISFISASESGNGKAYLLISSEAGNFTSLVELQVPEPAMLGLMGLGVAGLVALRRRRGR